MRPSTLNSRAGWVTCPGQVLAHPRLTGTANHPHLEMRTLSSKRMLARQSRDPDLSWPCYEPTERRTGQLDHFLSHSVQHTGTYTLSA